MQRNIWRRRKEEMVGATKAGEDLAGQIIVISELFYNRKTQRRFLLAIRKIVTSEIEQLNRKEIEEMRYKEEK